MDGPVLLIECKDAQYRKTYGEVAEQFADFRREVNGKGKRDRPCRHFDRIEVTGTDLGAVAAFTKLPAVSAIESHLHLPQPGTHPGRA